MDDSVVVPRTNEGLSVVSSLSEVSEQIAISEELPTEHDPSQNAAVYHHEQENPNTESPHQHQTCEVQVVKVANVSLTFSTPGAAQALTRGTDSIVHIQQQVGAQANLAPIQEVAVAIDSPAPSDTRSSSPGLADNSSVVEIRPEEETISSPSPRGLRNESLQSRQQIWDAAISSDVLLVRCRNETAELYKNKLGSGGRGKCIKFQDQWLTPSEFEARCGRASSKDWKRSIRYLGRTLNSLIDEGILMPHAISCTCATCCDDDTLAGPVRLFVPYKRRKREPSVSGSPVLKKSMSFSSDSLPKSREGGLMMRSVSVDSATAAYCPVSAENVMETGELPPGTMVVVSSASGAIPPNTPLTPITPGTPGTPVIGQALTVTMPVPGMSADNNIDQRRNWWHIEEMVNSLLSTAQQLKVMVEQAKLQSEAAKDAAVAQAKMQGEAEKKEALAHARMNSLIQLSRALNEARAEKETAVAQAIAQTKADRMEAAADAKEEQLIKAYNGEETSEQCVEDPSGDKEMVE